MKLAGLVSICTAITLTGFYLSYLQNKRLKVLRELCAFFSETGELGGTGFSDFTGIFKSLAENRKYTRLTFIEGVLSRYDSGENLKEIWEDEIRQFCPFYVNYGIKQLLLSFSEVFGRCTRDSFIKRCEEYSSFAEKILSEEEKRYEKNRSITVYSGALTAAAVFFIFI